MKQYKVIYFSLFLVSVLHATQDCIITIQSETEIFDNLINTWIIKQNSDSFTKANQFLQDKLLQNNRQHRISKEKLFASLNTINGIIARTETSTIEYARQSQECGIMFCLFCAIGNVWAQATSCCLATATCCCPITCMCAALNNSVKKQQEALLLKAQAQTLHNAISAYNAVTGYNNSKNPVVRHKGYHPYSTSMQK